MRNGFGSKSSRDTLPARIRRTLALTAALVLCAAPAFALNEPQLVSTYPAADGAVRSGNLIEVAALYDRDLDEASSGFVLLDNASVPVPGFFHLSGERSETGGYRIAAFHPTVALSEGGSPYLAKVKARTAVPAHPTHTTFSFSIDDTAPAPPVFSQPLNGQVRTDQPVVARGTAEPGSTVVVAEGTTVLGTDRANDVGAFRVELAIGPEDGVWHSIYATATDGPGNVSAPSSTVTFWHDSIVRVPFIRVPMEASILNSTTVEVAGDAKPNTTVILSESAATIATTTADETGAWSVLVTFSEGAHSITATSWDGVTHDGPSPARAFTVDMTAPAAPVIVAPAAGAHSNSSDVTISGTAEGGASVRIRHGSFLRATAPVSAAGMWSVTLPFNDGTHTISATAVDAASNSGASAFRSFVVDTVAPTAPVITTPAEDAFVNANPVVVGGVAEAGSTVRIFEGTVEIGSAVASGTGSWSTSITFTQAAHSITAIAIDGAQNHSVSSPYRSFTVDTTAPLAPVITTPVSSSTSFTSSVKVAGTAEPSSTVEIKEGATTIGATWANGTGDWSTTVTFSNGSHTITARATDAATNTSPPSAPVTFTVSPTGDTIAPAAPVLSDPSAGSIQPGWVTFSGTAEPLSTVRIYEGPLQRVSGSANASGQFVVGVSMSSGSKTVTATATDAAGNASAASAPRMFTVDADAPTVAFTTASGRIYLPTDPVVLEGRAGDNLGVDRITLEYRGVRGELVLTADAGSCTGCPATSVTWSASHTLPTNVYTVHAYAVDRAGNRSAPATLRLYRL